jgi:GH25 family lysozyme M1 (1,4-beta-N-acetylmuramidase)
MNKKGIDISKWQGTIDFNLVKKAGIQFVIPREGYRKSIDEKFLEYVSGCKANNIEIPGVYHFLYCTNVTEARQEAKSCINNIKKAGLEQSIVVFADFEYDTVEKAADKGIILGKKACIACTEAFLDEIHQAGYQTGIYANIDYYKNMYTPEVIEKHVFWLADYSGEADYPCTFRQTGSKGIINGISGAVDTDEQLQTIKGGNETKMQYSRQKVVDLIKSWEGLKEADNSFRVIIDIYNSFQGTFPRGIKMQYSWAWCACTWSALAIKLGYTSIMPIEISCYYLIEAAKKRNIWVEQDSYIPQPGDAVLYDWQDSGSGDNTGNPDHVGTVIEVHPEAGYMIVLEGNYSNAVKRRMLSINGKFIRGFITPKYTDNTITEEKPQTNKSVAEVAKEVIVGKWGTGEARKNALEAAGYDYKVVQAKVNDLLNGSAAKPSVSAVPEQPTSKKVTATSYAEKKDSKIAGSYITTANLYLRNDAGTNKKALVLIPKGYTVQCYGYYSTFNGAKWYYIQVAIDGTLYTGFSHSAYLKRK